MSQQTKRCRFCGEEILAVAIKCKHCGSMLGGVGDSAESKLPIPTLSTVATFPADPRVEIAQSAVKTKKNGWWRKQKNAWWPDVSTPMAARSAKMYGVWASVFIAVVNALLASWSLGSGEPALGLVDAWSFIDVAIFVAVAFGIYKGSRFAAVAGLVIFAGEKIYQLAVTTTTSGTIMAFILAICYVAAIRGTYALRRLGVGGNMDYKARNK